MAKTTTAKKTPDLSKIIDNLPEIERGAIMQGLSWAERAAVKSAIKDDNSLVSPGTHEIDVSFRVNGYVTKGEDYTRTNPVKISADIALGVCLSLMSQNVANVAAEKIIEILNSGADTSEIMEKYHKNFTARIIKEIKRTTTTTVSGPTKFAGTITRL